MILLDKANRPKSEKTASEGDGFWLQSQILGTSLPKSSSYAPLLCNDDPRQGETSRCENRLVGGEGEQKRTLVFHKTPATSDVQALVFPSTHSLLQSCRERMRSALERRDNQRPLADGGACFRGGAFEEARTQWEGFLALNKELADPKRREFFREAGLWDAERGVRRLNGAAGDTSILLRAYVPVLRGWFLDAVFRSCGIFGVRFWGHSNSVCGKGDFPLCRAWVELSG